MNDVMFLSEKLKERIKNKGDILYQDYKPINKHTSSSEINLKKVRGSIRLRTGKFILPNEVEERARKAFKINLP